MTEEINKDNMDLASFIDSECQSERQAIFGAPAASCPDLLDETPERINQRRSNECLYDVEAGRLFHGWITGYELRKASNGSPYLRFECQLEANGWKMTSTRFLPRNKISSTELIAEARDSILLKLGYDPASKDDPKKPAFPHVKLFEIGSWQSEDGKKHLNIKRIFNDTRDYNSYKLWEWENKNKKKQWTAPDVALPE